MSSQRRTILDVIKQPFDEGEADATKDDKQAVISDRDCPGDGKVAMG
jgi:hypothetical protein